MLSEDPIFQDYTSNQTVNFNSTWNSVKVKSDSGIQTDQIFTKDSVSQSQTYSTQSVQTLPEKPFPTWPLEKYDRSALAVFISSVEPMISSTLLQNIKSNAFDDYTVEWQDEINEISCILNLEQKRREIDTICTQVSWSKSGSVVAAAYGRFDHESCCTHKGVLATWNVYLDSDIIAFSTDVSVFCFNTRAACYQLHFILTYTL